MPALPNVANVVRAQLLWTQASDADVSTSLFFSYSGSAPNSSDANNLAVVLSNAFGAIKGDWAEDTTLSGARVTDLSSASGGQGEATSSFDGTRSGDFLTASAAFVLSFAIARRYRGGKPRVYLPWGTWADLLSPTAWSSTTRTDFVSDFTSAIATFVGTTEGSCTITDHVNVSYYKGSTVVISPTTGRARNVPTLRDTPVVDQMTAISAPARVGSQRRRLGR